jgi:hypothetical protein
MKKRHPYDYYGDGKGSYNIIAINIIINYSCPLKFQQLILSHDNVLNDLLGVNHLFFTTSTSDISESK